MAKKQEEAVKTLTIKPINMQSLQFKVMGTAPLIQAKFSAKSKQAMMDNMAAGTTAKSKKKREPRDFDADMLGAMHVSSDGWVGQPATAFRNALIDTCRMVGFKMTFAKMSIFVEADGLGREDGVPLVKLDVGDPERSEMATRNANGSTDIRIRPMWRSWGCTLRVRYDADQFTAQDVANLLERAGQQCGIGEGRPFSRQSNGLGFGTFTIKGA